MLRRIFCKLLLVAIVIFSLLALSGAVMAQGRSADAFERVKEVQELHTERLMALKGVEGTAIGYNQNDRLAIKVFTAGPGVAGIPKTLDGVAVQVVITGKFYALSATGRYERPVPIGVSTGHPDITAGTIGCRVKDAQGNVYALSNNHVYANENLASIGDNVLQPGTYDGGVDPDDAIGTLEVFEPIVFHPRRTNTIDAAIALTTTDMLDNATPTGGYGTPSSTIRTDNLLDLPVQKYGRTTGLTTGVITDISVTVRVGYSTRSAIFVNQIIITPGTFSYGGDSGSLIVTDDPAKNPVGLLFAGSSTMTVANPIDAVLSAFGVTVDNTTAGEPPVLTTIEVSPSSVTLNVGDTQQFTATGNFDDDSTADLTSTATWESSIITVAAVDASGLATGVAVGTTDITATQDGVTSNTASLVVTAPPPPPTLTSISATPISATIEEGQTQQFTATGSFDDGSTADLTSTATWASSNTDAATVDASGLATGIADGTTDITATQDGVTSNKASLVVTATTVTDPTTVSVSSIAYDTEGGRDGRKHLLITVALVDDLVGLVAGASVSINLLLDGSFDTSGTGTTGTDGTVTFKVANSPSGIYTTYVTNVAAAELIWDGETPPNEFSK